MGVLLFLLAALSGPVAAPAGAADVSARDAPSARGLAEAYRATKDPDARFWIVDALRKRLEEGSDEGAVSALLDAAKDPQADVRRSALSALEGVAGLPSGARARWREKAAAAAFAGANDGVPRVREAAQALQKVLAKPPRAARKGAPAPLAVGERPRVAFGAAIWAVCVQVAAVLWLRLALSVLSSSPAGRLGLEWSVKVLERNDHAVFPCLASLALFGVAGVGGALALSRLFAPGVEEQGRLFPFALASTLYGVSAFAALAPAMLLARRAVRAPEPAGVLRAAFGSMVDLPAALALAGAVVVVWPLGLLFSRAGAAASGRARWMAAAGAPFAGLLLAARSAAAKGWGAAWRSAVDRPEREDEDWLRRPFGNAHLLALCLATPFVFGLSSVIAGWLGSNPARLLELWFVSDVGFAWVFGVWAGGVAVSIFLAFWLAGAALYAASGEGTQ